MPFHIQLLSTDNPEGYIVIMLRVELNTINLNGSIF